MIPRKKIELLKTQLTDYISSFERKRNQNKTKAFLLYFSATAISATVTVLLGLQGVEDENVVFIRNSALILSATVTLLTGFETFFNHRALWVRYTQTATELNAVQLKLNYLLADAESDVPENDVDRLFDEMQRALSETNRWWQDQRAEELPKPKPPNKPMQPTDSTDG